MSAAPSSLRTVLLAVCAVAALQGPWGSTAQAQSPQDVLLLWVDENDGAGGQIVAAVQSVLSDVPVTIRREALASDASLAAKRRRVEQLGRDTGVLLVAWWDASVTGVDLFLADPSGGRVLIRRVPGDGQAVLEEVALIVRSACQVLSTGGTLGVESAPLDPTRGWSFVLGLGYRAALPGPDLGVLHALDLWLGVEPLPGLVLSLGYGLETVLHGADANLALEVHRHPLRMRAAFDMAGGHLRFGGDLGLGVAYVRDVVRPVHDRVVPAGDHDGWMGSATANARIGLAIGRLQIIAFLGLEVVFRGLRYLVQTTESTPVIVEPRALWPSAGFELSVDVF